MSNCGVSIALCTFNGAKYLSPQLESYLVQTHPPDELVICDDRSRDETVAILNDFAERAPFPVRIFVNEQNMGSAKNFEKAISLCSGDVIFLSDQDDVWAPNKVKRIFDEFQKDHDVGMVFSDAELVDEALRPLGRNLFDGWITPKLRETIENGNLFSILLERNVVTGATLAFRARYNKAVIPIPVDIPDMIHDGWIAMILSVIAGSVLINEPLVKYRQHDGQQLGMDPRRYVRHSLKLSWKNAMERIEAKHKVKKEYMESAKRRIVSRIEVPEDIMSLVEAEVRRREDHAEHYRLRNELSDNRVMRIWPIMRELLSGRYHRCSNGVRAAARDLVVDHKRKIEYFEIMYRGKAVID